jgi:hypothetical protein
MSEKTLEKPETKTCEACGKEFGCGAASAKCWCFEIDLSKETLGKLRQDFKSCLCKDCLDKENKPRNNTN